MALPASQYSVLDAKQIERIDDDTFRCYVGGLHLFNLVIEPVLTVSVIVTERGPTVKLLSTEVRGPHHPRCSRMPKLCPVRAIIKHPEQTCIAPCERMALLQDMLACTAPA